MTNEELLKSIRTIISEEIKGRTDDLIGEMEVFGTKQTYFEIVLRSITQEQRETKEVLGDIHREQQTTRETLGDIQKENITTKEVLGDIKEELKSLQKKVYTIEIEVGAIKVELVGIKKIQKTQGRKINSIDKTVDVIGRMYDEDIVKNAREIEKIKDHLRISKN